MAKSSDFPTGEGHARSAAASGYSSLWRRVVSMWQETGTQDCLGLLYSANYLLKTAGVRWAIDPFFPHDLSDPPEGYACSLSSLDYIVLTHSHWDHFDLRLLRLLRDFPTRWIVPHFLVDLLQPAGIPNSRMTVLTNMAPIRLGAVTLTPFEGLHWEENPSTPGGRHGVPALGYLAEFNGKRWLFPGDTRSYDASRLPNFGPVDGLVVHLWLGRRQALESDPPLLDDFCLFCINLQPRRIMITHLNELRRDPQDIWTSHHGNLVLSRLASLSPGIQAEYAIPGDFTCL